MLLKVAWRNLWRNWRRSTIVLCSMVVGVMALLLTDALNMGMIRQILENQIGAHTAHVQIHRPGFLDNPIVQNYLPSADRVESVLQAEPRVRAYSRRVLTFAMLSSALNSSGVTLVGVLPEEERQVTYIARSVVEGTYLTGGEREILLSRRLAEKMDLRLGEKVVAMATALDGTIGSDLYRVVGLYETHNAEFDRTHAYINLSAAQKLLGLQDQVMEFALLVRRLEQVDPVKIALQQKLGPQYEVLTFREILPLLVAMVDVTREFTTVLYLIVGIAMIFGIVNIMLMAVSERIPEFGVLMAIGMRTSRVFGMILLEALVLGALGTGIGLVLGFLVYWPLAQHGLNLSMFRESLASFGSGAIIYPALTPEAIVSALVLVPLFSVLGALYPASKAVRLQPVQALRFT